MFGPFLAQVLDVQAERQTEITRACELRVASLRKSARLASLPEVFDVFALKSCARDALAAQKPRRKQALRAFAAGDARLGYPVTAVDVFFFSDVKRNG